MFSEEIGGLTTARSYSKTTSLKGLAMEFLGQTWVMVGMGLALVALIGVMIFLRMKPKDEE